ncbi:hypothetical protein BEP19_06195 [Ammoniphilus oxalaticus]|uniref:HD/PDEase domain-containing protein n=1 Tax=Ammoniphilus oxalaticus TaxID=66863 RepID=A0A419SJ80_9BACL|nr:HD family phosphohydrolase [Ammoniphilus oxalaticus]RKD24006.1 hypothetical protein BEP19_06195 [Ammoniphilus oxalaticus]
MKKRLLQSVQRIPNNWKTSRAMRALLFVLLAIAIYFLLLEHVIPKTYDLQRNMISDVLVTAPMEVEDTESTKKLQGDAIKAVSPIYTMDERIIANQLKVLDQIFRDVTDVKLKREEESALTNSSEQQQDKEKLKELVPYNFSDETYQTLLKQTPESLATMKAISRNIVSSIMLEGFRSGEEVKVKDRVTEQLTTSELESRMVQAIREVALATVVPNIVFDEQATEQAKDRVARSVKPVIIHKGEILVGEGEYITDEIYRKLGVAGLLTHNPNYYPYIGLALFVSLAVVFFHLYISKGALEIRVNNTQLLMFIVIILLNLVVLKTVSLGKDLEYSFIGFLAPVAFGSMLIVLFIDYHLALFAGGLFSICASLMFNSSSEYLFNYGYGFVALAACVTGAYCLHNRTKRRNILLAGLFVVFTNIISVTSIYMLFYSVKWAELFQLYGFAITSGLLASILTIGFVPFLESSFGILSSMKLIELSSPNQPLLRRLLMETPGTYHHSIMVANLSEAAAEAIGANGLLARVGAYYHDVGKMKRPQFFIENQMGGENPHDKQAPTLSRTIILSHTEDGVKLLQEYNLPKPIQDIAAQHHGTSLLRFFYHKATQEATRPISEEEFRYPGPKPQFKEAAIVGICDSVEAAVRSLAKPSPEQIENLVRKIVKDRLDDRQLSECDLTFLELEQITQSICETLKGIFHTRIEYPAEAEVKHA